MPAPVMPARLLAGADRLDQTEHRFDQPETNGRARESEKDLEKNRSFDGSFDRAEQVREPRTDAGQYRTDIDDEFGHNFHPFLWNFDAVSL